MTDKPITDWKPIVDWWGDYNFLNPNQPIAIEHLNLTYPSLRHALEAMKSPDPKEREEVAKMTAYQAGEWGKSKPTGDWADEYYRPKIEEWALYFIAQKYGVIPSVKEYSSKVKYGYYLAVTAPRPLRYMNMNCDTFWGKCDCHLHTRGGAEVKGTGQDKLGYLLEVLRGRILAESQKAENVASDVTKELDTDRECDWCWRHCHYKIIVGNHFFLWLQSGVLHKTVACNKHFRCTEQEIKRVADNHLSFDYPISQVPDPTETEFFYRGESTQAALALDPPRGWRQMHNSSYTSSTPASKDTWGSIRITPKGSKNRVMEAI